MSNPLPLPQAPRPPNAAAAAAAANGSPVAAPVAPQVPDPNANQPAAAVPQVVKRQSLISLANVFRLVLGTVFFLMAFQAFGAKISLMATFDPIFKDLGQWILKTAAGNSFTQFGYLEVVLVIVLLFVPTWLVFKKYKN